jgi:hypothetical protein
MPQSRTTPPDRTADRRGHPASDRHADRGRHALADRFAALRAAARAERAGAAAVDTALLTLLILLLGRLERLARTWHPAPAPEAGPEAECHTPCGINPALLYLIGPGPNRGMHPHARRTPQPRPRAIAYWNTALPRRIAPHAAPLRPCAGKIPPSRAQA